MPIANVVNMCSHLQNAARQRLGLTSVPHTKYNLAVALAMHRAGFLTFLTRGGPQPPDPATISTFQPEDLTTASVSRARLWLGLKYSANEPVMRKVASITTSKRPVTADLRALNRLVRGFDASYQQGLNLGEALIVSTDRGVLEAREAVDRRVGGLLLCRLGP